MILLDENILEGQRVLLEARRLAVRQIGVDLGRKGLQDEQIIVLLRDLSRPTFFTRDAGFHFPDLRHRSYCLVVFSFATRTLTHKRSGWVASFESLPLGWLSGGHARVWKLTRAGRPT